MRRTAVELSIIVPVYNEQGTIARVIRRLRVLDIRKEIVIVDDGSTDGTWAVLQALSGGGVTVLRLPRNQGKGSAFRAGLRKATGTFVVCQDGDLETDPADIVALLDCGRRHGVQVILGVRRHRRRAWPGDLRALVPMTLSRAFNTLVRWWFLVVYQTPVEDPTCVYKIVPRHDLNRWKLRSRRFDLEVEIAACVAGQRIPFIEHPIVYTPRSYGAGKKIGARDAVEILWTLVRLRWTSWHGTSGC